MLPGTPPRLLLPRPRLDRPLNLNPFPLLMPPAFSCAPFRSIPVYSHHRRDTRAPGRQVACLHGSRIGRVAIYFVTIFCLRIIDVRIPTIPASFITPASGGYIQLLSLLCRGCLPVIFLATLDWNLSRAFSIRDVETHVSAQRAIPPELLQCRTPATPSCLLPPCRALATNVPNFSSLYLGFLTPPESCRWFPSIFSPGI